MEETVVPEPTPCRTPWIDKVVRNSAKKDKIEGGDLAGEFVALILMSIALWFFVAHKVNETGFYTEDFGTGEMLALYSAGAFVVFVAVVRIALRRHNVVRPLEAASMLLLVIAHAVLLARFPFDFEHVAAVLPGFLEWTVGWISDTIGWVILALGIPGGILGAAFTLVIYFGVKREFREIPSEQISSPSADDD